MALYIALELGRPQTIFPFLDKLYLAKIVVSLIAVNLIVFNFELAAFKHNSCLIYFVVLMIVDVPIASNNYAAFWTTYSVIPYAIFCIAITSISIKHVSIKLIVAFMTHSFIILALLGLFHKGIIPRSSFMGDQNEYSLAIAFGIPFVFFKLFCRMNLVKRMYYVLGLFAMIISIFMSMSTWRFPWFGGG